MVSGWSPETPPHSFRFDSGWCTMGSAITGYVGLNGSGKSLAIMQQRVLPAFRAGQPVLSNIPLYPNRVLGYDMRRYELLTSLHQLEEAPRGSLIVLDDISAVFPSRGWESMPAGTHALLQQLRKLGCELCWSAPTWERVDVTIRELTFDVVVCRALWRKGGVWGRARFVMWSHFEVSAYLANTQRSAPGTVRRVMAVKAKGLYDSLATVEALSHLDGSGVCIRCGGQRKRQPCSCHLAKAVG